MTHSTEKISKFLKDFSAPSTGEKRSKMSYRHSLSSDNYDQWRLLRYIFSEILNIPVQDQPFEKINWWIPFTFLDTYHCVAAHEKFGFRIYVSADSEQEGSSVGEQIEEKLGRAINMSLPDIEHLASLELKTGNVIVENHLGELKRPYIFFRKRAESKRKLAQKKGALHGMYITRTEQRYFEDAAYFTFFSWLEHLCVLFLAFKDIPERGDVAAFARLNWSEKFKLVFDISDREFKEVYDQLLGISRYRRNPASHGHAHEVFSFYLKGARHKIAVSLNEKGVSIRWNNQSENFAALDGFMKLISNHPSTRNILKYLENDFNVQFSSKMHDFNLGIATMTAAELDELIEITSRSYDDAANMDW